MIQFTQIKETCLYSDDLEGAESFYTEVLGLPLIRKEAGRFVFLRAGSSVLLIFNPKESAKQNHLPPHDGFGRIHLAFEVGREQYEKTKSGLVGRGIEITHVEPWPGRYESFYFNDPDGHVLEVVQAGMWD